MEQIGQDLPALPIIISALLAMFFELFPPLRRAWDEAFNEKQKQILMLFMVAVVSIGLTFYIGWRSGSLPADPVAVVEDAIIVFLLGLVANQGTYSGINRVYSPAPAG